MIMTEADINTVDWTKGDGLVPAIVQDATTLQTLMLGYMNSAALTATLTSGYATFFSRSRGALWQKGETSGNRLAVQEVHADCDRDALLMLAKPTGPTCHTGDISCFGTGDAPGIGMLGRLAHTISERASASPGDSYTARLLERGTAHIAQKVGEEAVEVALATVTRDKAGCAEEIADLVFHLSVLMHDRDLCWDDIAATLRARQR